MRPCGLVLAAGMMAAAGCAGEVTGVATVPAYVTWMEWPTAVTAARPGALRLSGYTQCPYRLVFGVSVSGSEIRVSAAGIDPANDVACVAVQAARVILAHRGFMFLWEMTLYVSSVRTVLSGSWINLGLKKAQ